MALNFAMTTTTWTKTNLYLEVSFLFLSVFTFTFSFGHYSCSFRVCIIHYTQLVVVHHVIY